ncbi:hypothetical protein KY348_03475 [Candidatus Woesearchaeota archaeon]|nr:hypothetical protein [Candidatus Woesearchaeota archaeon]
MGSILSSRREKDKVIIEASLDHEELVQLKGEIDNVHLFSEEVADLRTNISRRGKNEATKYFLIPRHLRKDLSIREPVSCQRINTPDKAIFVYVVNKNVFYGVQKIKKNNSLKGVET